MRAWDTPCPMRRVATWRKREEGRSASECVVPEDQDFRRNGQLRANGFRESGTRGRLVPAAVCETIRRDQPKSKPELDEA